MADEDADGETVTLEFIAYGDDDEAEGVFEIRIGDVDEDEDEKGDIDYTVEPGDSVELDRSDFNSFFKEEYSKTLSWVTFSPTAPINPPTAASTITTTAKRRRTHQERLGGRVVLL